MNVKRLLTLPVCFFALAATADEPADLIVHNGRIVTVDKQFSVHAAMAVRGGAIAQIGTNEQALALKGNATKLVDLNGKVVIPGLIDSHVHATDACMHEFDHPIPEMNTIGDVLAYIRSRAAALKPGEWIHVRQVFITRLEERRYPTREELDGVAPNNPVLFSTGPDASANTLALKESGIDKTFKVKDGGPGYIELDPKTGEPTGILRGCTRYVKTKSTGRDATFEDRLHQLRKLIADYNSVGITGIVDRNAGESAIKLYQHLHDSKTLDVRVAISHTVGTVGPIEEVRERIRKVAAHPLRQPNPMLRIIGIKTFLDGGMLTGSAYMRDPWGVSAIYSITDPQYRGVLQIPQDRLVPIVRTAVENGLQFTAHSVGDGAVHNLLDAYAEVNKTTPIRQTRPCITHSNFMSQEAVELAAKLGVVLDIQPAWLYLDTRTLTKQFSLDRLRYFQPLKSIFEAGGIVGGGSDHMQKIGSLRAVNPYNPFLGMWVAVTRNAKDYDGPIHPEEALTREQALRFYTANNAFIMFLDDKVGSLEAGKRADFVVLDRDLLTCPIAELKDTKVLQTYLDGRCVYDFTSPPRSDTIR